MMNLKTQLSALLLFLLMGVTQNLWAVEADIVVALDGTGDFIKIQDAIDAVPSNQTDRSTVIFIKNGLYDTEKLIVTSDKINVTLIGESRDQTIISYHIYDCDGGKCPAEDAALWSGDNIRTSATLTIQGKGFRAENMTIQNTAGPVGQAQALTIRVDKCVFINCDIKGYQDTIYFWQDGTRSYFKGCLVVGRTDYIYGDGIVFFDACEIRSWGGGWITAPSTPQSQAYGFVFSNCDITYATDSPRNGDDGGSVRFGRPWHEYPKVAWLNCAMTEKINPEGWGDTWNMSYASTSTDLHLYEYNNTGAGADMSGRAAWAGIKALNETEAAEYTAAKVLNGSDGWAPYEEAPLVTSYEWDGNVIGEAWQVAENWNPDGIPAAGEVANITGNISVRATGGTFAADLNLSDGAKLNVEANSTVSYLAVDNASISGYSNSTLSGKIATKDTMIIVAANHFTIDAALYGVHKIIVEGTDTLVLSADNSNFSGIFILNGGTLQAVSSYSLGKASVEVPRGSQLIVDNDDAFFPEASLSVALDTEPALVLNAAVTLSEFYIDGVLQGVATYDATTNPGLISGTGSIVVGRPSSFTFSGGNWDDVTGYTPTLLPEAGETVFCEGEMETTSTDNLANITFVEGKGNLRLRGVHKSTGTLTFEGSQRINYATGGEGFTLDAPIVLEGDVRLEMSSGNVNGSTMTLKGSITGSSKLIVKNTRSGDVNTSKVWLGGNNSAFSGFWDVTTHASNANGVAGIVGASANAFGTGTIMVGNDNFVQFDHVSSVSESNDVVLESGATAIVNENITVGSLSIAGSALSAGTYSASTHPDYIQGTGAITVTVNSGIKENALKTLSVYYKDNQIFTSETFSNIKIYSLDGVLLDTLMINGSSVKVDLTPGIYIVTGDDTAVAKLVVNN